MNLFERHIQEHLSGPVQKPKPEWIRRAKRNGRRRALRLSRKLGISGEEARARLIYEEENKSQAQT